MHAVARACAREAQDPPALLSINCMTLQAPSHIFRRMLDGLNASQPAGDLFICPGMPRLLISCGLLASC